MPRVTQVTLGMLVDGEQRVCTFIRPEKLAELLTDEGSLGSLLRSLRDSKREEDVEAHVHQGRKRH